MYIKRSEKGFIDFLSLIAVVFLVLTVTVGTFAVTNKGFNFNIQEKADAETQQAKLECADSGGKWVNGKCQKSETNNQSSSNSGTNQTAQQECEAKGWKWQSATRECKKPEVSQNVATGTTNQQAPAETCLNNNGGTCVKTGSCISVGLVNGSGSCNNAICCYRPTNADLQNNQTTTEDVTTSSISQKVRVCVQDCVAGGYSSTVCNSYCTGNSQNITAITTQQLMTTATGADCSSVGTSCGGGNCSSDQKCLYSTTKGRPVCVAAADCTSINKTDYNGTNTLNTDGTTSVTSGRADGQCLGPGEKCGSGQSYFDTSCTPTEARCGVKEILKSVAVSDGGCLGTDAGILQICASGKGYVDLTCGARNYRCGIKSVVTVGIGYANAGVTTQPLNNTSATSQEACSFNGKGYVLTYTEGATTHYTQTPCGPSSTGALVDSRGCTAGTEYVAQLGRCTNSVEAFLFKTAPEDPTALIAAAYLTPALSNLGPITTFGGKFLQPVVNFLSNPFVQTGIRIGNTGLNAYQARQACANPQTVEEQNRCTEAEIYLGLAVADYITGFSVSFNLVDATTNLGRLLRASATATSIAETGVNIYQTGQQCFGENANTLGCILQGGITAFHGGVVAQDLSNQVRNFSQVRPIYLDAQTQLLADAGLNWSVFQGASVNPEYGGLWNTPYFVDLDTDLALRQDVQNIIQQVQATNPQSELDIVRNASKIVSQDFSGQNYNLAARNVVWEIASENEIYVPLGNLTSTNSTVCLENSYLCSVVLNQMGISASTRYLSNVNPGDSGHAFVQAITDQGAVWTDPTWGGATKLLGPVSSLEEYATQIQQIYKFERLKSLNFPLNELIYTGTGQDAPTTFDQLLNQNH